MRIYEVVKTQRHLGIGNWSGSIEAGQVLRSDSVPQNALNILEEAGYIKFAGEQADPQPEAPTHRTVQDVLDEVGDDVELAEAALMEENLSEHPRVTLVDALEKIIAGE